MNAPGILAQSITIDRLRPTQDSGARTLMSRRGDWDRERSGPLAPGEMLADRKWSKGTGQHYLAPPRPSVCLGFLTCKMGL